MWAIARRQRGVITHAQLLACGYSAQAIHHRIQRGRLHPLHRGVYAIGRAELSQEGKWMAAVLACGPTAALSHDSAAALWKLAKAAPERIRVSILGESRSRKGIAVHRRTALQTTTHEQTLIDVAATWPQPRLEQAIGEADLRGLVSLRALKSAATKAGRSGAPLRAVIAQATFRVTQSELEREFLRMVERAHVRSGRTAVRLTHWQVFHEAAETTALLVDVFTACQCRRRSESTTLAA